MTKGMISFRNRYFIYYCYSLFIFLLGFPKHCCISKHYKSYCLRYLSLIFNYLFSFLFLLLAIYLRFSHLALKTIKEIIILAASIILIKAYSIKPKHR